MSDAYRKDDVGLTGHTRRLDENPNSLKWKEEIDLHNVFRDYIKHEDGLVNNRITWMLTIHGFLYATYGLTLQKKFEMVAGNHFKEIITKINGADVMRDYACSMFYQIDLFLILIAAVGIIISLSGYVSIIAAQQSIEVIVKLYKQQGIIRTFDPSIDGYYQVANAQQIARRLGISVT